MNKTNYNEIASAFHAALGLKQYRYATKGFTAIDGGQQHSAEGSKLYEYFQQLEGLAYTVANNLKDNDNFDRDVFLKDCGMQLHSDGSWEFVPKKEYIEKVNR